MAPTGSVIASSTTGRSAARARVHASADVVGGVDADAPQADHFGVVGVGEVGDVLRRVEARVALHRPLFPGHLIQVAVVEHEHDQTWIAPTSPVLARS